GEELGRIAPVLEGLAGLPVSVDTSKAVVARKALELGAELVNDITALRADPELAGVVADSGAYLCLMHMKGEPRTMQLDPRYDDVAGEVAAFLEERLRFAVDAGIAEERICLDPGIGFGKTGDQNFELVGRHGVREEERRDGRTFLYDVRLEVSDSALSDRIEDTVDYREVAASVREVSDSRSFQLIEALAGAVADALAGSFPVERVRV